MLTMGSRKVTTRLLEAKIWTFYSETPFLVLLCRRHYYHARLRRHRRGVRVDSGVGVIVPIPTS